MKLHVRPGLWRLSPLFVGLFAVLLIPAVGMLAGSEDDSDDATPYAISGAMEINVDQPAHGQQIGEGDQFAVGGWAVDPWSDGPGVDMVVVFADGLPGEGGTMLGAASYGMERPDVAAATGVPTWTNSGFDFSMTGAGFEPGPHTLFVFAHSTDFDQWGYSTVGINVVGAGAPAPQRAPDSWYSNPNRVTQRLLLQGCGYGYVSNGVQCVYIGTPGGYCPGGYASLGGSCTYGSPGQSLCPAGYSFNGAQCVYAGAPAGSCPAGYVYLYGSCTQTGSASCSAGYLFNGSQCVYVGNPLPVCTAGSVYLNGACTFNATASCGAGYFYDGTQCVYAGGIGSATVSCPAGSMYQNGLCQANPVTSCGPGYYHNGTSCVFTGNPVGACPGNSVYQNGSCSNPGCSAGYDSDGRCLYSGGTSATCPAGSVYQNGSCGVAANLSCNAGYVYNGTQCVSIGVGPQGSCPAGAYYSGGQCITVGGYSNSCLAGSVYQSGSCRPVGTGYCGPYFNPYANRGC